MAEEFADAQRRHADRVDGEHEEAAVGVEQPDAIGEQGREMLLEPPHFAFGAAPELGGVEQDAVVAAGAADFTGGEFGGVVDDPADRAVGHSRQLGIAPPPVDRFFGSVDMDQPRPGVGQCQRADPGVAEQVEHVGIT